jgi:hypothetical protein
MKEALLDAAVAAHPTGQRTTAREDLGTVIAGTWLIVGVFLDGYAHQHLVASGESFITPWHAVFYAGFIATASWIALLVRRRPGQSLRERVPDGHWPAVLGLGGFAIGGIGDGLWHSLFGVEVGIDALLSPTHLLLMVSLLAIVTAPYQAALARPRNDRRAGGLPLVSLGIGAALVAFFINFIWGLGDAGFAHAYDPASAAGERDVVAGVASAIATTAFFTTMVLFVRRLGRTTFPTFALLFGLISLAVHVAFEEEWIGVAAALVAGLVLDATLSRIEARRHLAVLLGIVTGGMWLAYYGLAILSERMAWPTEIWTGTAILCSLAAVGIALVDSRGAREPATIAS